MIPHGISTQAIGVSFGPRGGGSGQDHHQGLEPFRALSQPVSFLFQIDELSPHENSVDNQEGRHWTPPERSNQYDRQQGLLYRWTNGEVTVVPPSDRALTTAPLRYQCATVFTQWPDTHHFLAVAFDAQEENVCDKAGWHPLGFNHCSDYAPPGIHSYFDIRGERHHLAALGSASWVRDLFPEQYRPRDEPREPVQNTGLTGKLTLLLAVIAFSCMQGSLDYVLQNCLQPGQWSPHGQIDGRLKGRGMVVSVFYDPGGSDKETLDRLQHGHFGAFLVTRRQ